MKIIHVAALTLALTFWAWAQPIGKTLPEFTFQTTDGKSVTLSELRQQPPGGVLLLTFWCTDCASCRATEESLAWMTKEYAKQARVVAIASSANDTAESIEAYLRKHGPKIHVLLDPNGDFAHYLKVNTTTTSIVVDRSGRLRYYGTLKRGKRFFAQQPLKEVLGGKIVGQPRGPIYG